MDAELSGSCAVGGNAVRIVTYMSRVTTRDYAAETNNVSTLANRESCSRTNVAVVDARVIDEFQGRFGRAAKLKVLGCIEKTDSEVQLATNAMLINERMANIWALNHNVRSVLGRQDRCSVTATFSLS